MSRIKIDVDVLSEFIRKEMEMADDARVVNCLLRLNGLLIRQISLWMPTKEK